MGWSIVSRTGRLSCGLAVGLVLVAAQLAAAAPVLQFNIQRSDGAIWGRTVDTATDGPITSFEHHIDQTASNPTGWKFDWTGSADIDPVVNSNFVVTNTTASTQTYTVTLTSPVVPPIPGSTMTGGSLGGSVTDGNGNGATVAAPTGSAIYTALIDGVSYQQLNAAPYSQSASQFLSNTVGPSAFGTPIPNQPGPPALTSIGITLSFTLTAGDQASFTSNFIVVPEPAGLSVLGIAVVGLLSRRRRVA